MQGKNTESISALKSYGYRYATTYLYWQQMRHRANKGWLNRWICSPPAHSKRWIPKPKKNISRPYLSIESYWPKFPLSRLYSYYEGTFFPPYAKVSSYRLR